jgi:hypothetical protein
LNLFSDALVVLFGIGCAVERQVHHNGLIRIHTRHAAEMMMAATCFNRVQEGMMAKLMHSVLVVALCAAVLSLLDAPQAAGRRASSQRHRQPHPASTKKGTSTA